ncbi:hypothetical protein FSP39_013661 [Pinctada imbricata]|uniref:Suppressor APC domain-containing protein n=1 Tax=Pinctada imbricata TaxID=66713 RepID=A0AA88XVE9_PINIB|nr:hypothetical protein FSP39_013661 [Pinctada imbricata]
MTSADPLQSTEGLPKQFVASLKILFDILDEKGCGYVHLDDIETRWHEEGVKGLPGGVTEALRKVTPTDGYLSFDRFVTGLKLALLTNHRPRERNQSQTRTVQNRKRDNSEERILDSDRIGKKSENEYMHSENVNYNQTRTQNGGTLERKHKVHNTNTAAVQPNNALRNSHEQNVNLRRQRPLYGDKSKDDAKAKNLERQQIYDQYYKKNNTVKPDKEDVYNQTKPALPAKPHIGNHGNVVQNVNSSGQVPPKVPPRDKSKRIITELKNWQRRVNGSVQQSSTPRDGIPHHSSDSKLINVENSSRPPDSKGHGHDLYENIDNFHKSSIPGGQIKTSTPSSPPRQRSVTVKRRDSARRHTLANGVDYNMIKRMKQLETEKDVLLRGLDMVEKAREWYHKQVLTVEEKLKYVGKTALNDHSLEATQERMNFQHARITEVNQQLRTLIESSEKGFPLHMNLAMGPVKNDQSNDKAVVKVIKEQNQKLSKEVKDKSDKITQLEKEKAALVRELFEARSKNKTHDDTTFL